MEIYELNNLTKYNIGNNKKIKLIVSDIEGCLNLDEKTYDHEALEKIRIINQLARHDNPIPLVTVCSGRQLPFVEAIIRMIDGKIPAIFENGCGLFYTDRNLYNEYEWHPTLHQPEMVSEYDKVKEALSYICEQTQAKRVIGKEILISIHPKPPMKIEILYHIVEKTLAEKRLTASVCHSATAVDIAPHGIDKGTGLTWLISVLSKDFSIELSNVAGIGDSKGDLPFLSLVGFSTSPANASEDVKKAVIYCSQEADGKGVVDILDQCIAINMEYATKEEKYVFNSSRRG